MTLLLATDDVELYRPDGADEHGWTEPSARPYWRGRGNLQLAQGPSDPRASQGGGHGPYSPAADELGLLYLPADVELVDGTAARIRDQMFVLSQARLILDPAGTGLDLQMATATGTGRWPDGG